MLKRVFINPCFWLRLPFDISNLCPLVISIFYQSEKAAVLCFGYKMKTMSAIKSCTTPRVEPFRLAQRSPSIVQPCDAVPPRVHSGLLGLACAGLILAAPMAAIAAPALSFASPEVKAKMEVSIALWVQQTTARLFLN